MIRAFPTIVYRDVFPVLPSKASEPEINRQTAYSQDPIRHQILEIRQAQLRGRGYPERLHRRQNL